MITTLLMALVLTAGQLGGPQDGADEISALVERIREGLARVDETLLSTLDADDPRGPLDDAVRQHQEVIRDLEELIRQAKYQRSNQGGGGGGGSQDQSSGQQGNQQQQQQPQARESDGSQGGQDQQDAPQPSSGEEESPGSGEQDQPAGADQPQGAPEDGSPSDGPGGNRDGPPPPPEETANPLSATGDERWGLLPPKLQERLVNLHVDDVPPRYRDWLSAYIRAMRKVEEQEGP